VLPNWKPGRPDDGPSLPSSTQQFGKGGILPGWNDVHAAAGWGARFRTDAKGEGVKDLPHLGVRSPAG